MRRLTWDLLAFKDMDRQFPLYGKLAKPPISPEAWWTELIQRCMLHAGASQSGACWFARTSDCPTNRYRCRYSYWPWRILVDQV
jgi:hypothetical protein